MIIIVSDASPVHYLALIGEIQVLPTLYERVIIPPKVLDELQQPNTPKSVKDFIASSPSWLDVCTLTSLPDPSFADLDPGEREAITLALEINADALLIDDNDGREAARLHGLRVIGTLAVLYSAAEQGLCDLDKVFEKLKQTNFRASISLYDHFLNLAAQEVKQSD